LLALALNARTGDPAKMASKALNLAHISKIAISYNPFDPVAKLCREFTKRVNSERVLSTNRKCDIKSKTLSNTGAASIKVDFIDGTAQEFVAAKPAAIYAGTSKENVTVSTIVEQIKFKQEHMLAHSLKPWETGVLDGTEWDPEHMESKRPPIMDRIAEKAAAWSAANTGN